MYNGKLTVSFDLDGNMTNNSYHINDDGQVANEYYELSNISLEGEVVYYSNFFYDEENQK